MIGIEQINLSRQALRVIQHETLASLADGNETGDILLGSTSETGPADVTFAGTPGPDAVRRPGFFLRDLTHTQAFANRHFFEDGAVWVGEWHTHPDSSPTPSRQDLSTYRALLEDPELEFAGEFISLIIGPVRTNRAAWSLIGWVCSAEHMRLVRVQGAL